MFGQTRLQQELLALMMSGDKGISAFPNGDDVFSWVGTIVGPQDTVSIQPFSDTYTYSGFSKHLTLYQ